MGFWRRPFSKKAMTAMVATSSARIAAIVSGWRSPWFCWKYEPILPGMSVTMPAKMRSEIPLETPRSVICSPIHIRKAVPVVSVMMVISWNGRPGWLTMPAPASLLEVDSRNLAMPNAWNIDSATVP